jgi:hypothetical protein
VSAHQINNLGDVYQFVEILKTEASQRGLTNLATQLENALKLGSSGLEILGAIRQIIIENREIIRQLLGPDGRSRGEQIIDFVDRSFRR